MISAGELRHVVTVKRPATTKGSRGQNTGTAATLGIARAKIETLSGRELEIANQVYAGAALRVTIRHFPGLVASDYLEFGSRRLEIGHVENVEQKDWWNVLLCSEDQ
jgi:head-tail adaptor